MKHVPVEPTPIYGTKTNAYLGRTIAQQELMFRETEARLLTVSAAVAHLESLLPPTIKFHAQIGQIAFKARKY